MLELLRQALRKSLYIVREEGIRTWMTRATRIGIVKTRRAFQDKRVNLQRWSELRGRFHGQRAFIVGNGPSLNDTPMHLLKGEHVICFNRFHLMFERLAWRPDMYAVSDDRVAFDIADELVQEVLPEVDYAFFPDIHPFNVDFRTIIPARDNVYWMYLDRLDFSDELPYAGMNKTVANVAVQVLAYLGFNPIYLIGVDMSYARPQSVSEVNARDWTSTADDDPNHFDPRYFGQGRKYHNPRIDETRERYLRARDFFNARGVEIVNAGVGGELDVFPRVPFRSLFGEIDAASELELLREAVDSSDSGVPGAEIDRLPRGTNNVSHGGMWIDQDAFRNAMPDLLRTHLVFGPTATSDYLAVVRASGPAWG
ncbi:MAG: 6-hydroxymethylpterin diphosphokinase MptE-like protein [Dehalococcoidia bacterium]